ncbi:FAD:protein FMN transferase [Methyloradius palustris]|uniref:FAD:protein FMN transferase n=1 Tax=Methyloradius palustris TaxID=2778876 RepID=A0A8D5GDR7_9PROT|nr:FAD:protein FMN transferase [Methyloradius palustris]BCM25578.1 FAD:protein FMN transferase [Methyloradius palustris]
MDRRILIPPQLAGLPARLPVGKLLEVTGNAMGTSWAVKWVDEGSVNPQKVTTLVAHAIEAVVTEMSTWQADSCISRFNSGLAGSSHHLPAHFSHVLECALEIASDTDGAFDPTIGPLVNLWGFGPDAVRANLPPQALIFAAKALCGWHRLELKDNKIKQPGGFYLDFSGIAKGYSVDLIAADLRDAGVNNFLVEVGGELSGFGIKPDGQPWWVALENPMSSLDGVQTIAALHGLAIATSGDYRRYFDYEGTRYSHTIDPRTGSPVLASCVVTVLHSSCMRADAIATALMVMGVSAGLDYAARRGIAVLFTQLEVTQLEDAKPVQYASPALLAMAEGAA